VRIYQGGKLVKDAFREDIELPYTAHGIKKPTLLKEGRLLLI